jgi:hypothetical protein
MESLSIQNRLVNIFNLNHRSKEEGFLQLWMYAWMLHHLEAPYDNYGIMLGIALVGIFTAGVKWMPIIILSLQSFFILSSLPKVANHHVLVLFVNIGIIFSILGKYYFTKERKFILEKPTLNYILALVAVMYFFAYFHKLNASFFDLNLSCATNLYQNLLRTPLGKLLPNSTTVYQLNIYIVLVLELAIALFVLIRFKIAFYISFAFHALLSFAIFYDFSAVILSLFFLLRSDEKNQKYGKRVLAGKILLGLSLTPLVLVNIFELPFPHHHFTTTIFVIAGFSLMLWPSDFINFTFKFRKRDLVLLFLFLVNALAPYLGLKTVSSLSMFSNLRTEGQFKNHLIVSDQLEMSQNNNDLILINSAYGPPEEWVLKKNQLIPFKELRRVVTELRDQNALAFSVNYSRNGETFNISNGLSDQSNIPSLNFFERKLLGFRSINANGVHSCQW